MDKTVASGKREVTGGESYFEYWELDRTVVVCKNRKMDRIVRNEHF